MRTLHNNATWEDLGVYPPSLQGYSLENLPSRTEDAIRWFEISLLIAKKEESIAIKEKYVEFLYNDVSISGREKKLVELWMEISEDSASSPLERGKAKYYLSQCYKKGEMGLQKNLGYAKVYLEQALKLGNTEAEKEFQSYWFEYH